MTVCFSLVRRTNWTPLPLFCLPCASSLYLGCSPVMQTSVNYKAFQSSASLLTHGYSSSSLLACHSLSAYPNTPSSSSFHVSLFLTLSASVSQEFPTECRIFNLINRYAGTFGIGQKAATVSPRCYRDYWIELSLVLLSLFFFPLLWPNSAGGSSFNSPNNVIHSFESYIQSIFNVFMCIFFSSSENPSCLIPFQVHTIAYNRTLT